MSNQDDKNAVKGELLAHGADNYLHDPNKSMNYYAQIRTDNGTVEKWGKDLESVIKESGVQVGDTVVLAELGKEPVVVGDKTFNKTIWDLQRYEPALELPNAIEHDEKELSKSIPDTDKTKEKEENIPSQPKKTPNLSDFDFELPSNIKNNYIAIIKNRHLSDQKINYYDKDDKDQVNIAFEDRNKSLHTSRQDDKTIYAMLDMAQSKGWSDIKLKGTEEFKQKAWLEASLRGIGVKGYEPNEKDLAELQAKQAERTTNQVEMTAQKAPEPKQEETFNERLENPANNVENLHNYNISISQDILGNALAMKENHYERGYTSEKEVLSDNYFAIDPKNDFYIANQLNKDVSEFKNHHYAIDRTSDTYFIKQMVNELNISDDVKRDFELKFNNRMTEQFYANDSYDMPHENFSLRNYAVLARSDLEQSLNKFNEPNRDLVIKSFDGLMVDYSKQVVAHQKSWLSLQETKVQPTTDIQVKSDAELTKELKKEVTQIFQNGYKDGTVTNLDGLIRELKECGYEVKENDKSIRVTDKNGTAITVKNEPFTKVFDAVKSLKDELKPETIKANYPNIDDVNIANITAYKNYLLEQFKTPQALEKSLSELNQGVKDLANGKSINFPTLPPNEERPVIDVRVPESGEKSRIK